MNRDERRVTPICTTHRQIGATPNLEEDRPVLADLLVLVAIVLFVLALRR